jgi:hypothetical protein
MSTLEGQPEPSVLPDNTTSRLASDKSKRLRFRDWLFQGAIAGTVAAFLFVLAQVVISKSSYNVLVIPTLPIYLTLGLILGIFQSLILWSASKITHRHPGALARAIVSVLFFVLPVALFWWFSSQPTFEDYHYPGRSPNEVDSLQGIKRIKLVLSLSYDATNPNALSEAQRRNLVAFSLNDAGIEVVEDELDPNLPVLCIDSSFLQASNQKGAYDSRIRLSLRQNVSLNRDPRLKTEATTWEYREDSLVGGSIEDGIIKGALSNFVEDYERANSRRFVEPSYEERAQAKVRWSLISFGITILFIGFVSGSRFRPWRALAYGIPRTTTDISTPDLLTGVVLRSMLAFLLMESILALVCTIQSDYQPHEFWRAHAFAGIAVAHCVLSLFVSFGQLKYAVVASVALLANFTALLLCWFHPTSNWSNFFIAEYSVLGVLYLLTRVSFGLRTLAFIKQELKYYLIE